MSIYLIKQKNIWNKIGVIFFEYYEFFQWSFVDDVSHIVPEMNTLAHNTLYVRTADFTAEKLLSFTIHLRFKISRIYTKNTNTVIF